MLRLALSDSRFSALAHPQRPPWVLPPISSRTLSLGRFSRASIEKPRSCAAHGHAGSDYHILPGRGAGYEHVLSITRTLPAFAGVQQPQTTVPHHARHSSGCLGGPRAHAPAKDASRSGKPGRDGGLSGSGRGFRGVRPERSLPSSPHRFCGGGIPRPAEASGFWTMRWRICYPASDTVSAVPLQACRTRSAIQNGRSCSRAKAARLAVSVLPLRTPARALGVSSVEVDRFLRPACRRHGAGSHLPVTKKSGRACLIVRTFLCHGLILY
ncbi:hypothetical protein C8Q79DRAFT_537693 [Trametes meyenii]|nr:hypothetical protein C8Q79DRAFT_537693 [Trametes meyenii]